METREIVAVLAELSSTKGLAREHIKAIAGCAEFRTLAAGDYLWRQGEESTLFFLIRSGQVALEISVPGQGPFRIEILGDGEFLGCANLIASTRCQFDARAMTAVSCLAIQGERLYRLLERDQKLGYELLKRLAPMMTHKLESARLRLLDLHGLGPLRAQAQANRVSPRAR